MDKILRKKKGFTLIEIIIVLVIIAILAAATVPAMIGFVNDARSKAYVAEARLGLVAAQAVVTEVVASGGTTPTSAEILANAAFDNMTKEVSGTFSNIKVGANERVTEIVYTSTNGYWVSIINGKTETGKGTYTPPAA